MSTPATNETPGAPEDPFRAKDALFGVGLMRDPHPRLHELMDAGPVHAGSMSGQFGMIGPDNVIYPEAGQMTVVGFDAVEEGFRDPERFSNSWYQPSLGAVIGRTILEMDPPEHYRFRLLLQGAFSKKEMQRWEREFVRDIVRSHLEPLVPRGRADLATEFAFHYPITVTAVAAGLPVEDVPAFYRQAALLTNVSVPEATRRQAARELGEMVQVLIDERRREPKGDLIGLLVDAEFKKIEDPNKQRLTDDEIVAFLRLLVPAGAQTTYRSLTNLLFGLLTHPDQFDAVQADRSLIPAAIEEGLRWEAPLLSFGRTCTRDTTIAGQPIPAGSPVNLCVHAANHDASRWDRPDEFDIFRPPLAHIAFGQGNHICLGIHFARMELRVALEEILDRLPNLRLDPDATDVHITGLSSRTAINLPCVWDPRES
ncbi:MAG TPA: cytochrome P450 [Acidimicrobiales bacterium]|nr:cytochrome P450 [Acidimicrobiales bacterium]